MIAGGGTTRHRWGGPHPVKTIQQLLDAKGREVWTVGPDDSVYTAIERMAKRHVGALVVKQNEAVVGIVSERDYARKVILQGRSSRNTPVSDIMTARVIYTHPGATISECMNLITEKRIRHLPVMEDEKLVGIISIGDLVKAVIAEQEFLIEQLQQYIAG